MTESDKLREYLKRVTADLRKVRRASAGGRA